MQSAKFRAASVTVSDTVFIKSYYQIICISLSFLIPRTRIIVATIAESLPHLVARASRPGKALVEEKLRRYETRELRVGADAALQLAQCVAPTFVARQRDVGVVGPVLGNKSAGAGRGDYALLEAGQLGREADADKKHAGAVEEPRWLQLDFEGRVTDQAQAGGYAGILVRVCLP